MTTISLQAPTLYYHPLASYCHKVLIALYEKQVAFERRVIDLADSAQRAELGALWPLVKFPVLNDPARGRCVAESSIIIEYLDQRYPNGQALIPSEATQALEVRLWDRVFDNYVQGPMQEIVFDRLRNANGDLSQAHATLRQVYGMLEKQIEGREWIAAPGFSLADCAAAPALFFALTLEPFPAHCERLAAYFERLVQRPSFARVLDEARPQLAFYPFYSAIAPRFR